MVSVKTRSILALVFFCSLFFFSPSHIMAEEANEQLHLGKQVLSTKSSQAVDKTCLLYRADGGLYQCNSSGKCINGTSWFAEKNGLFYSDAIREKVTTLFIASDVKTVNAVAKLSNDNTGSSYLETYSLYYLFPKVNKIVFLLSNGSNSCEEACFKDMKKLTTVQNFEKTKIKDNQCA